MNQRATPPGSRPSAHRIRGVLLSPVAARALPWVVLVGAAGAGLAIARYEFLRQEVDESRRFADAAAHLAEEVEAGLRGAADRARDTAALFAASESVTEDEFRRWSARDGAERRESGLLGVAFARRTRDGAGTRFPVVYRCRALGPGLAPGPLEEDLRRDAMERAARTGRAAVTGAHTLDPSWAPGGEPGCVVVAPVADASPEAAAARDPLDRCAGFALAPVAARPLVAAVLVRPTVRGVGCRIEDDRGVVLHEQGTVGGPAARTIRTTVHVPGGKPWSATVTAAPGGPWDHAPVGPWVIVASGLALGLGLFGALRGVVAERERAERAARSAGEASAALRASEERLRLVAAATSDAIWDWDAATDRVTWSGDLLRQFGWGGDPGADAKGWWKDRVHPDDLPGVEAELARAESGPGDRFTSEYRFRRSDGSWAHVSDTATIVRDGSGAPVRMVGAMVDRTPAHRAEEEREARAELHRALFESAPYPMWLFDEETLRFVAVNAEARRTYGWSEDEFRAMTIRDIRPPEDRPRLDAKVARGLADAESGEWRHVGRDGRAIDVQVSSRRLRLGGRTLRAVIALDVTGRHALEEQLRQSQKMEAVGLLAGGIAHDFNNLLSVVSGYGEMLLEAAPADDPSRAQIREIVEASERAAALTRKLLAFSRRQDMRIVPCDANALVRGLGKIVHRLVPAVITVREDLAPGLPSALADPSQLEQAVLNVVVNARDAMPDGGTLTLRTRAAGRGEIPGRLMSPEPEGERFVVVSVSDTGTGMDEATLDRIFEPFFTTKEPGRGTGLGLSTVYGIVQQGKGAIAVESEPGKGSTFHLVLPATSSPAEPTGEIGVLAPVAESRGARVLVAEDHDSVRDLVYAVLKRAGHRVLLASSGEQALAIAATEREPFDVLVSDVVMPGIDGPELATRLRERDPSLPVVFLTGYADDSVRARLARHPDALLLRKPIDFPALVGAVRPRPSA